MTFPPAADALLLDASGIDKTFGRTRALRGASLTLRAGEIHALLGANGAGKSTLSKVISGHVTPDAGHLLHKGSPLVLRSPRDALTAGIAIVMQETTLAPDLTVLENIFLPELGAPGWLSHAGMRKRAAAILDDLGQGGALPLETEVGRLSTAQRQLVEIAKALALEAELIIFDEPTASLSAGEVERLFDVMARLKDSGRALVFVSHRLEEVFAITDRVTVMRDGETVASNRQTTSLSQSEIIRLMVGRDLGAIYQDKGLVASADTAPVVFEVRDLVAPPVVRGISFAVRQGEILGLGGLVGAGRSEAAEAIFGLRPRTGGEMWLAGKKVDFRRPADAVRAGLGFVPEDRRVQNIVPDMSVRENLLLAHLGAHRGFGLGYAKRQGKIDELLRLLDLPAHRLLDASMLNFSGGMQQKIIIARWLLIKPDVLILDEPTKGVDIGTRQAIYGILQRIAAEGAGVVVISSDFEELLGVSTRIVVISDGYSIADMPSAMLDEEKLTLLAAPRTSMQRNTALLEELASECGGAGFWALIEEDRLICLNSVVADPAASPGFSAGEAVRFEESAIPRGLSQRGKGFVSEADGRLSTLVAPICGRRGHDLGWVGLTVGGVGDKPSADHIRQRIESLNA
ncbi:sugar ABC transporter ATP-binding protein [Aurantimonas sp. C2-6-R+9]|uniref:sugar ABC transporter ATP-binding protein n=1 Tax=unclassified Aurantimonas TaxID=2638230 RepID=UPI002E1892F6|nr:MULTISPECIES: sugar ABC transporter ATP-binding protein [unclassified Aurantimonas]MEC5292266.1 sugar ABC transporter ATP-binding protein [Aurantimonas sp. C2-3-R2]MEC5382481.1 sugar ABC transporter ATP-binding protein [Aurantimonas sp. C2-6-R+9]MEC5413351.1 sugar ABC transporter ATP-binding protein [Aurantimonas sp. C2-4-R8]